MKRSNYFFTVAANMTACMAITLSTAMAQPAETPSTADFSFLVGAWSLEAHQSPGTERETRDTGERICKYVLDDAYVRCDTSVTRSNGSSRKVVSLHNYNGVVERHESLYYFSNWPLKPLARTEFVASADAVKWINHFEFEIDAGRTEFIRSEFTYRDGVIENVEYLRTSEDDADAWRLNYKERLTRFRSD